MNDRMRMSKPPWRWKGCAILPRARDVAHRHIAGKLTSHPAYDEHHPVVM